MVACSSEPASDNPYEWLDEGKSSYYSLEFKEAIQAFDKAIQIDPSYAEPYFFRGQAYRELGEYRIAIQDFSKAIENDPSFARAYMLRSITYSDIGEEAKSLADHYKACSFPSHKDHCGAPLYSVDKQGNITLK